MSEVRLHCSFPRAGVFERPAGVAGCVLWALHKFDEWFTGDVAALLALYPPGHTMEGGASFWGGTKRLPSPLRFDPHDEMHVAFVLAAARLRGRTLQQLPVEAEALPSLLEKGLAKLQGKAREVGQMYWRGVQPSSVRRVERVE